MTSSPLKLLELSPSDEALVASLWKEAELIRPWNDPTADFLRAVTGPLSAVLGVKDGEELIGSVMVGNDGHRGWVYYLAVSATHRREGIGRMLMAAAEKWLRDCGAIKIQLMVRSENQAVLDFYEAVGYEMNDVQVLSRWLKD